MNKCETGAVQPMARIHKLADKAARKYGGRQVTPDEAEQLFKEYVAGANQQRRGEWIALVIERFLAAQPEKNRVSFESNLRELHRRGTNFKRFRTKAFILLMVAFQNGQADPLGFDLAKTMADVQAEISKKYEI